MPLTSGLTIGQAAAAAGLTRKAVRVYEAKGLLPPADRTVTGYRIYDEDDVELLTFIRRARKLGLHLEDIRRIIVIRNGGASPCVAVRDMLDERIIEIDSAVEELLGLRESLINSRRDADDCCAEDRSAAICSAIEEN
ncbi:MerR family transcriptional regulator [Candidatus Mycobacterium wuenschmannii]|uniref:MerR family transcriptional regulator n=1 Tax=Candidatus Mycobacterium wuenschmannii TaxID=3027808 RepID=A0ABY8VUM2_9MYCO|nr:MerR family transcriptional regulator [Candidatus Mycobacterium wuenschmannii]WIM87348.1 MerR family transcriptional regulator [Candidatus Mycobacterium wuenschmannii]